MTMDSIDSNESMDDLSVHLSSKHIRKYGAPALFIEVASRERGGGMHELPTTPFGRVVDRGVVIEVVSTKR